jgi:hypothetical protein
VGNESQEVTVSASSTLVLHRTSRKDDHPRKATLYRSIGAISTSSLEPLCAAVRGDVTRLL